MDVAPASLWVPSWLKLYFLSSFGAFVSYILTKTNGDTFADKLFQSGSFRWWLESLFLAVLGGVAVLLLVNPDTPRVAFASGLGWTGLIHTTVGDRTVKELGRKLRRVRTSAASLR